MSNRSNKLVQKILSNCLDTDKKKLPTGVTVDNISQVKLNSYCNSNRDSVSLNLYFTGVSSISNTKYYSVDNLTVDKFMMLYNAIYDVKESKNDIFDIDDFIDNESEKIIKEAVQHHPLRATDVGYDEDGLCQVCMQPSNRCEC